MQAGARVNDGVAGGQLHALVAKGVFNDQLAALVFVGVAKKDGGRDIAAQFAGRAGQGKQRVVNVVAIGAAAFVAVKARGQHFERQGGRQVQRVVRQFVQKKFAQRFGGFAGQRQLQVVLNLGGQLAGGGAAIFPGGLLQGLAAGGDFFRGEQGRNSQQHGDGQEGMVGAMMVCARNPAAQGGERGWCGVSETDPWFSK